MIRIGVTERGDAALDLGWQEWVLEQHRPAILITKDPAKLLQALPQPLFPTAQPNILLHCTITGWGGTVLEPNVPTPEAALEGYRAAIQRFGVERVMLRVDPVLLTKEGKKRAETVLAAAQGRVRISFLDLYPHVKERFQQHDFAYPDFPLHAPLQKRRTMFRSLEQCSFLVPEVCGEPDFQCTGCISATDCTVLEVMPEVSTHPQRAACACLGNKQELLKQRGRCFHGCLYCYWKDGN